MAQQRGGPGQITPIDGVVDEQQRRSRVIRVIPLRSEEPVLGGGRFTAALRLHAEHDLRPDAGAIPGAIEQARGEPDQALVAHVPVVEHELGERTRHGPVRQRLGARSHIDAGRLAERVVRRTDGVKSS